MENQAKPFDIVGLGVIAVDDMMYSPFYPPRDSKTRLTGRLRQGGGTIACGLAAAAKLGSRCTLLGRLGDNEESDYCRKHLGDLGIDLSKIVHEPDFGPVYTAIVVAADTGSRAIFADYTTARPLEPDELKPEWFADAKVLLVDHLNPPAILAGVKIAKKLGLTIVSDIERHSPQFEETRTYIDHLVCSEQFSMAYTKADTPELACKALAESGNHEAVVVTAGNQGCWWVKNGDRPMHHHPAHKVKAIDTTGCGDVFHGSYCHGVAQDWPIDKIIAYASAAAAIKATRTGGWLAVPTIQEVEEMMTR